MLAAWKQRLRWSYRKNVPDLASLAAGLYPRFVYGGGDDDGGAGGAPAGIPVFHFHSLAPDFFAAELAYLGDNGYRTLTADEYWRCASGGEAPPRRAVMLTFDDGRASLWTVGQVLLERFGMRGVCFIVPGLVREGGEPRPVLDAAARGGGGESLPAEALRADSGPEPLCSWREIEIMHQGGVIDFQSHTLYHHLIPVSPEVVDFYRPALAGGHSVMRTDIPITRVGDVDRRPGEPLPWGTPIYRSEPRMTDAPRFFPDAGEGRRLEELAAAGGGESFFTAPGWRPRLAAELGRWRREHGRGGGRHETAAEQRQALFDDLAASRRLIEERLPGASVRHLCYPWFRGGRLAVEMSRAAGYRTNFWGSLPAHFRNGRRDPLYHVPRLEDLYVFRLPGRGRWPLARVLARKAAAAGGGGERHGAAAAG